MRTIEFRAWDKTNKKMVDYFHISSLDGSVTVYNYPMDYFEDQSLPEEAIDHEDYELMQFTGLLDKNGTKIFEGDIVRISYEDDENISQVKYKAPMFVFENSDGHIWQPIFFSVDGYSYEYKPEMCEVIGNIYQSPELIK